MGQIIDRIINLARAYVSDLDARSDWAESMLDSDDDELRKIIEELASGSPPTGDTSPGRGSARERPPVIPPEVAEAYTVFGLTSTATSDDVKATYRKLMIQWHPDRFVNGTPAEQDAAQHRTRQINAAYIILRSYHARS